MAQPAFFDATNGIQSAYDWGRVPTTVLAAKPNDQALKLVATSAAGVASDSEKAQVLIAAAKIVQDETCGRCWSVAPRHPLRVRARQRFICGDQVKAEG